ERIDSVYEIARAPLELELRIERKVEGDRQAVVRCDRPAFLPRSLNEHLVGPELAAVHAEPAALELLELAGLERRAHGAELLAELGAEHGQVRLHAQLACVDDAELH